MIIDKKEMEYITKVISVAKSLKIEDVIIEPGKVRAIDSERNVFILHTDDVPDMSFNSIGLSRLDTLIARLNIAKTLDNCCYEFNTINDTNPYVKNIIIKAKGFKVDFRCANPNTIQAPKAYKKDVSCQFVIQSSVGDMMTKGAGAMKSDEVIFNCTNGELYIEFEDINGDNMSYLISDTINKELHFKYKYPLKLITTFIKQDIPNITFELSSKGILSTKILGFDTYLFPRT